MVPRLLVQDDPHTTSTIERGTRLSARRDWHNDGRACDPLLVCLSRPRRAVHRGRRQPAGALRHPADRGLVPPRELPRARCGSGSRSSSTTTRSTASSTCMRSRSSTTRRCSASGRCVSAAQLIAMGARPGTQCTLVRPVARAGARPAGLGARLHHRVRRGGADDAVQGQVGEGRCGPYDGGPVHLPRPPGRRHPALPGQPGAGRRGPAPAPRADPRPRRPVQPPVRRHVRAARAAHHQGRREDHRPAGARPPR